MTTEQAINAINTWLLPMRRSAVGSMENEFLDAVEVLERNAIKYRWHDLKANPNDLPEAWTTVLICGVRTYNIGFVTPEGQWCYGDCDHEYYSEDIEGWRYIKPFEVEE